MKNKSNAPTFVIGMFQCILHSSLLKDIKIVHHWCLSIMWKGRKHFGHVPRKWNGREDKLHAFPRGTIFPMLKKGKMKYLEMFPTDTSCIGIVPLKA